MFIIKAIPVILYHFVSVVSEFVSFLPGNTVFLREALC